MYHITIYDLLKERIILFYSVYSKVLSPKYDTMLSENGRLLWFDTWKNGNVLRIIYGNPWESMFILMDL